MSEDDSNSYSGEEYDDDSDNGSEDVEDVYDNQNMASWLKASLNNNTTTNTTLSSPKFQLRDVSNREFRNIPEYVRSSGARRLIKELESDQKKIAIAVLNRTNQDLFIMLALDADLDIDINFILLHLGRVLMLNRQWFEPDLLLKIITSWMDIHNLFVCGMCANQIEIGNWNQPIQRCVSCTTPCCKECFKEGRATKCVVCKPTSEDDGLLSVQYLRVMDTNVKLRPYNTPFSSVKLVIRASETSINTSTNHKKKKNDCSGCRICKLNSLDNYIIDNLWVDNVLDKSKILSIYLNGYKSKKELGFVIIFAEFVNSPSKAQKISYAGYATLSEFIKLFSLNINDPDERQECDYVSKMLHEIIIPVCIFDKISPSHYVRLDMNALQKSMEFSFKNKKDD
jgi:hypothetical protein